MAANGTGKGADYRSYRCFEGRTMVVTGGAAGIGAATVRLARDMGARVAVLDLQPAPEAELALRCDVCRSEDVQSAFAEIDRRLGPVSVLVNNAGMAPPGRFEDLAEDAWNRVVAVNLTSVFLCTRAALPQLRACQGGSVTNVASIAGRHRSFTANAAYTAAKGGVIALTRQLAYELAPYRIRVNSVCPGMVDTDLVRQNISPEQWQALVGSIPLRRLAGPEEIAATICFLASDAAGYTTGAAVDVNGGLL